MDANLKRDIILEHYQNPKDKGLIEKVKINEKYEIELYNWLGTKITQDISQGQRR